MTDEQIKTFCVLPWIHSFVNLDGEYQVCCTSEEFKNDILDTDGNKINVRNNPETDEIINSEFLKKLRRQMLSGIYPSLCQRCKITEDNSGISRRIIENNCYSDIIDNLVKSTKKDGTIPCSIMSMDYRLGNECNLCCRMCNPRASSNWMKMSNQKNDPWITNSKLMDSFQLNMKSIQHLHFAGGEPFLSAQMKKMLSICIESGFSRNIILTYNTNITTLPKDLLAMWKNFKDVRLLCSIDAFGKLNEYIRTGSKWDVIDKNLEFLDNNATKYNISEVLLSTTVQAYNVIHLDKLFEYLEKFNFIIKIPNLINLFNPEYMSSQILPKELKEMATERCRSLKLKSTGKVSKHYQYLVENIDQVINYMNSEQRTDHFSRFIEFNKKFDLMKNLNMAKVLPEFVKFIKLKKEELSGNNNNDDHLPIKILRTRNSVDLHICWELFTACNNSCSYCFNTSVNKSRTTSFPDLKQAKKFVDRIIEHYVKKLRYKKIIISFTGGEPTIWNDFSALCEYIVSKNICIGLTSNGSAPITFWENHSNLFDFICLSFHPESVDIQKFSNVYQTIDKNPDAVLPTIRIMMHTEEKLWKKSISFYNMVKENFRNYQVECVSILHFDDSQFVQQEYKYKYMNDFLKSSSLETSITNYDTFKSPKMIFEHQVLYPNGKIEKLIPNNLVNQQKNKFKGWACHIGLEQIYVCESNEIYPAECFRGNPIGYMGKPDEIKFPTTPTICKIQECNCPTNIMVSKYRIKDNKA